MAEINQEEVRKAFETFQNAMGDSGKKLGMLEQAAADAADAQKHNMEAVKGAAGWLGKLGSTILSAEEGSAKYASSITAVTDTVGDAASKFGILGMVVGEVIKLFGGMAAASLKQNDALIKSYRTLSDFGAIDSGGLEGTLELIQNLGGNTENADKFLRSLKASSEGLVLFGGTAANGTKAFSEATKVIINGDLGRQLTNLGYTTEDITKYGAHMVAQQSINGLMMRKDTGAVSAVMTGYLKNLTELSMLTGKDRDQAQAAYDAQQRELGWRLKLNEIAKSGPEGERQAQRLRDSMAEILLTNEDLGHTIMEQVANNGNVVSEKAAMNINYFGDIYKDILKLSKTNEDVTEGTFLAMQKRASQIGSMIDTYSTTGKINTDQAAQLGLNVQKLDLLERLKKTDLKEFRKELEKLTKDGTARLNQENDRARTERLMKNASEKFIFTIGDLAVPAVGGLVKIFNALGTTLANMVYWLTKTFGKQLGVDVIDMRDMFKTFDTMNDVTSQLVQKQKEQKEIQDQLNANDKVLKEKKDRLSKINPKEDLGEQATDALGNNIAGVYTPGSTERERLQNEIRELEKSQKRLDIEMTQNIASQANARAAGQALNINKMQGAAVPGSKSGLSPHHKETEGVFAGLTIKDGDVQDKDQKISPNLIKLAQYIEQIPGFVYFSAFNDQYHQKSKDTQQSNHKKGLALDFTLSEAPDEEGWKNLESLLRNANAINLKNEYANPSRGSNAGHIHAEVSGKTQGMFKGPESGYWLKAHGEEALMNEQGLTNLITKAQMPNLNSSDNNDLFSSMLDALTELKNEITEMKNYTKSNVSVNEEILRYAKA